MCFGCSVWWCGIETQMHEDPEDLVRIIERDIRLERPSRG